MSFIIKEKTFEVEVDGKTTEHLTLKEYELLRYLVANSDRVVSKEEIVEIVWGNKDILLNTVEVYVKYIRNKVSQDAILTRQGFGYQANGGTIEEFKRPTSKDVGETSDGYHTFNELYRYRMLYNAAFFNMMKHDISDWGVHKSRFHSDGEPCFGGGWFIVVAYIPTKDGLKQISNHYEEKYWDLFDIEERVRADQWDGHTPEDAANRIESFLKGEVAI